MAFLLRKYLLELQELKTQRYDDDDDDDDDDVAADDAPPAAAPPAAAPPRDAFEAFARRHQPRTSLPFAAAQEEKVKAQNEQNARAAAAEKKAKAKANPAQAHAPPHRCSQRAPLRAPAPGAGSRGLPPR